jgi:HEAT repeat protein
VREAVVRSVHFDADDHFAGRLELISALATDTSEKVRHSVAAALAQFADNEGAMKLAVEMSANDASPKVRAEALESLALAHYGGMLELVLDAYMQAAKSPSDDVRKAIAGRVSTLPADPRVAEIVGALLADANVEVRKKMAWYGVNMADHPTLKPLFERVAESDPDESVRAEAVSGMRGFYKPTAAIAYARQRLAADPTEKLAWTCVNIARSLDDERDARFLLEDVAKCKHEAAAASAQEALRDL